MAFHDDGFLTIYVSFDCRYTVLCSTEVLGIATQAYWQGLTFLSWICAGVATQRGIAAEVEVWVLIYVYGSRFGHGVLQSHIFISRMIVFIPLGIVMMHVGGVFEVSTVYYGKVLRNYVD